MANRLRSALTMLGIIFGVAAVIAAVSMTQGAKAATLKQFERFGTNVLTVIPGQIRRGAVRGAVGSRQNLTWADAKAIAKECPSVVAVAPQVDTSAQVKAGNTNTSTRIVGVTENFVSVRDFKLAEGAFFTADDVKAIKTHNPFAANDIHLANNLGVDVNSMNNYGSSLIFGHPQGPTAGRLIIEGIEEVVMAGGGYMLFGGCAAGDTGAAIVLKIG